jgi:hypothetical protein
LKHALQDETEILAILQKKWRKLQIIKDINEKNKFAYAKTA